MEKYWLGDLAPQSSPCEIKFLNSQVTDGQKTSPIWNLPI